LPRVSYSPTIRFVKEGNRIEPGRTAARLAREVFTARPRDVHALKFYLSDCRCIYCQRISPDGKVDSQAGIYRNSVYGACDACLCFPQDWKRRVKNDMVICASEVERE